MLGVLCIMALATIGIAVEQRQDARDSTSVQLLGVPANFIPHHIRCQENGFLWHNEKQEWQRLSMVELFTIPDPDDDWLWSSFAARDFVQFIERIAEQNKSLSFSGQQNSLILWVEPAAADTAAGLEYVIGKRKLPLRIGLLPILESEEFLHDQPTAKQR